MITQVEKVESNDINALQGNPFVCCSLTGSGSVTVESVHRHSSSRQRSSDDGQMDFSLTAIDLPALRLHLSGVITSNKDRWKELSVHGIHTQTNPHIVSQGSVSSLPV